MEKRTFHFIVNPTAGNGRGGRHWQQLAPALTADGIAFTHRETTRQGDGLHQARAAAVSAAPGDVLVAIGGDGTTSEVAAGLLQSSQADKLHLGVISAGTGNDLARVLGLPTEPQQAFAVIEAGQTASLDAGLADDHCFLNIAGVGFDAEVANAVNEGPKSLGGTVPYVLGLLRTLWRYRPVPMELELDGERHTGRFLLVAIANGRYFGGGMKIAPQAELADGTFDVVMGGDLSRLETLLLLPRIYKGSHLSHPKIKVVRAQQVKLRALADVHCQADGELLVQLPTEFSVQGRVLSVIVP